MRCRRFPCPWVETSQGQACLDSISTLDISSTAVASELGLRRAQRGGEQASESLTSTPSFGSEMPLLCRRMVESSSFVAAYDVKLRVKMARHFCGEIASASEVEIHAWHQGQLTRDSKPAPWCFGATVGQSAGSQQSGLQMVSRGPGDSWRPGAVLLCLGRCVVRGLSKAEARNWASQCSSRQGMFNAAHQKNKPAAPQTISLGRD